MKRSQKKARTAAKPEKLQKRTRLGKSRPNRKIQRSPQAAYEKLLSHELCMDLAGEFARQSASENGGEIGSIRFRYEKIVQELHRERPATGDEKRQSFSESLYRRYATNFRRKVLVTRLDRFVHLYVFACIDQSQNDHRWKLGDYSVGNDLLATLAKEHVRDRNGLMHFLSEVFKRWQRIFAPGSLWKVRLVTQQVASRIGNNRKDILEHLQKHGLIQKNLTVPNQDSWLSKIGQYLSRDQRVAAGKDWGFGRKLR